MLDMRKKRQFRRTNKVDELGLQDSLDGDAKNVLQGVARTFVEVCFNSEWLIYYVTFCSLTTL